MSDKARAAIKRARDRKRRANSSLRNSSHVRFFSSFSRDRFDPTPSPFIFPFCYVGRNQRHTVAKLLSAGGGIWDNYGENRLTPRGERGKASRQAHVCCAERNKVLCGTVRVIFKLTGRTPQRDGAAVLAHVYFAFRFDTPTTYKKINNSKHLRQSH